MPRDRRSNELARARARPHMRDRPDRAPEMTDQKNTILAIVLSALVLIVWQYFVGMPQMEKQRQEALQKQQQQQQQATVPGQPPGTVPAPGQPGVTPAPGQPAVTPAPGQPAAPTAPGVQLSREATIAAGPRLKIDTPRLAGSVSLRGGRLDDRALTQYRETVDPKSPAIELLSPSGSPHPFYAQFGWSTATGAPMPANDALWRQEGSGAL